MRPTSNSDSNEALRGTLCRLPADFLKVRKSTDSCLHVHLILRSILLVNNGRNHGKDGIIGMLDPLCCHYKLAHLLFPHPINCPSVSALAFSASQRMEGKQRNFRRSAISSYAAGICCVKLLLASLSHLLCCVSPCLRGHLIATVWMYTSPMITVQWLSDMYNQKRADWLYCAYSPAFI